MIKKDLKSIIDEGSNYFKRNFTSHPFHSNPAKQLLSLPCLPHPFYNEESCGSERWHSSFSAEPGFPMKPVFLQNYVLPHISHGSPELPRVQIPKDSVLSNPRFILNFSILGTWNYMSSKASEQNSLGWSPNTWVLKLESLKLESLSLWELPNFYISALRWKT